MNIAVIGGGIMGLALAVRVVKSGHSVTVYEASDQLGGLSTHHNFGAFVWDRFYHVILPSDLNLIEFVDALGLKNQLCWQTTRTGYYANRRFYPLSNNYDFLRFPLLSPVSKLRMAFTVLYGSRLNDWRKLEQISCEAWLRRVSGDRVFEQFWRPLLLAKLGEHYKRVSAVFIWAYIKRLASARDPSIGKEQLGHVRGGYHTVLNAVASKISAEGNVRLGVSVKEITPMVDGRLSVMTDTDTVGFDRVLFTGPTPVLKRVVKPELLSGETEAGNVEYLGVVCVTVVSKREISPFYVLNIADEAAPFTGVIGMSNAVPVEETAGYYLTYFPTYLLSSDPRMNSSDEDVIGAFWPAFGRMFPNFDRNDVVEVFVNRAPVVQPLQVIGYSSLVPTVETRHPSLFVMNTSQFVGGTLNNNDVVGAVNRFFEGPGASLVGESQ